MKRILIVEDNMMYRRSLSLVLKRNGFFTASTDDAKEALSVMQEIERPFDLVISDIKMPGMSGLELLDQINDKGIKVPLILITGYGNKKTEKEALDKNCCCFLHKPFEEEELLEAVKKAVSNK